MTTSFVQSMHIFLQLMRRDIYVYSKQFKTYFINYVLIYPLKLGIFFAYLQKNIYFSSQNAEQGTMLFVGSLIIPLLVIAYTVTCNLLFDIEGDRFIAYQTTILHPRYVLIQRIIFAGMFTFILIMPLFPMVKLFVGNNLMTDNTSWIKFTCMIAASALCCASYNVLAMCILSVKRIGIFWTRINAPLMNLAGMWAPLIAIKEFSPFLGIIAYANPLLYVIEGMRQAALGSSIFLPFWLCITALLLFTCIFSLLSWHFFKKRLDHI